MKHGLGWFRRLVLLAVLTVAPLGSARAAGESWTRVESEHFTVLTPVGEKHARAWALELEQFRRALAQIVPVPTERLRPVTVLLFRNDRDFRPYKPLFNGKPQPVGGLFVNMSDSHVIALTLDGPQETIRRIIFHEVAHWYYNALDVRMPVWLEEGLAEVYSTFGMGPDGVSCSFGQTIQSHLNLVVRGGAADVGRLIDVSRGSPLINDANRATGFYAAAWMATHYTLFGADAPGREAIEAYLRAYRTNASHREAFREGFGLSTDEFNQRLNAYVRGGKFRRWHVSISVEDIAAKLVVGPAKPGEFDLAVGVLLAVTRGADSAESRAALQRAAAGAPGNPRVWQALGEAALHAKRFDEALAHFTRALELGSTSYFVHYGRAALELKPYEQASSGLFDPGLAERAARDFRRALELNPSFVPAYEGIAMVMSALEAPSPADRALLEHAQTIAPQNPRVAIGLAIHDLKGEHREMAQHHLRGIAASADTPVDLRYFVEQVMQEEAWRSFSAEAERLFEQNKLDAVLELIDDARTRFTDQHRRTYLDLNRRRALGGSLLQKALAHANARRSHEALAVIEVLLASNVDAFYKRQAEQLQERLRREQ